jgi:hypothetical protein
MSANSSQHAISLVAEGTYGVTPANPVFKRKSITGTTLGMTKGTVEDETIRPDRQVEDVRHTTRQVGGDITANLTFDGFSDILEALLCGTWNNDVLVPGVTRRSFSVLRQFTDLSGGAKPFHLATGIEFNTLALTLSPEALVKAVFGVVGRNVVPGETAPAGATYENATAKKAFDAFAGSLAAPAGVHLTELSLNLENGIDPRFVVFDDKTLQPKIGKTRATGSMSLHFATSEMIEAFYNADELALDFSITDPAGNDFQFELPRILLTGGQPDVEGENDIILTVPFQALYDAGEACAIRITRSAA